MITNGVFQIDSSQRGRGGSYIITVNGKDGIPAKIEGEFSKSGKFLFQATKLKKIFH